MPLLLDKEREVVVGGGEARNACISGTHPSPLRASSAEVVLGLQFPFSPQCTLYLTLRQSCRMSSVQQICILTRLSRDISWSLTSTVQSAISKPCRVIFRELDIINECPSLQANSGDVMVSAMNRFNLLSNTTEKKSEFNVFSVSTARFPVHSQTKKDFLHICILGKFVKFAQWFL